MIDNLTSTDNVVSFKYKMGTLRESTVAVSSRGNLGSDVGFLCSSAFRLRELLFTFVSISSSS